jgi:hypothetical protein
VVGLARDHETLQPVNYFEKFVPHLDQRTALIIDPMLATAGSMIATIDLLKRRGCKDIRALVLVAAPEGIAALDKAHPDVRCWTASIDSHLNEQGYIIPGLGDAGDKIFGTLKREIQNWTGTNGVLEVFAGDKVVKRFLKIDKLSTALGTDDNLPRHYRFGYGVMDANMNGIVDSGEKRVYFEIGDYTHYVFFENPN